MNSAGQMTIPEPDLDGGSGDALPPGTVLLNGQYVIDCYLSSGGFGITYLARDSLDRRVVIKECYPEALCSRKAKTVRARSSVNVTEFQSLVSMFVREARSIAKLNHPNIVGVHQVFEDNETAYMALDLIDGQDLLTILEDKERRLSPDVVAGLLRKLLNAVATVHAVDMLHRDISPDNILLDTWGNPILIDFGAAREQASKKSRAISALLVVKDGYSPQEFYISGSRQGPCSDLYSLAATFYHLICGEAPPNSQNRLAALASKRPDPYMPLAGRIDGYDGAFLRAIDKSMNVFPQDRIQSAVEWLAMIDNATAPSPRAAQDDFDLPGFIASLVSEVGQDIDSDGQAEVPGETDGTKDAVQAFEKKWEYLTEPVPASPSREPGTMMTPERWADRVRKRDDAGLRRRASRRLFRRRLVLVAICAVAFNIVQSPDANLATFAAPEIRKAMEFGRDWSSRTADLLSAAL